jgi:ATP-dependent Clp protease ATP-binding subunit ClpB
LTEAVRRKPYSVLLLDEIEKAHPEVFNILLQVLDEGRLTDNQGRIVNFKNTIIIMTSNIGAPQIMERSKAIHDTNAASVYAEIKSEVEKLLKQSMRPEFLNRIDEIVVFHPLSIQDIRKIVDLQLEQVCEKIRKQGYELELTEDARLFLAREGYDPAFGARPLKRTIQRMVTNPLASRIVSGTFQKGKKIRVILRENSLDFT